MYENIYDLSFLNSFIFGTIFILINILLSLSISINIKEKLINHSYKYQPLIIFFLIFSFYTILFNILIIINFNYIRHAFLIILFLKIVYLLKNCTKLITTFNISFFIKKKIVLILFLFFFLISILPLSDADSIAVFLNIPLAILQNGLENVDLARQIEFTVYSNTETILLLSPLLKSDSLGAQLNLISLFFLIYSDYKKNKKTLLLIVSSPLIIYFISSQKLQLFFGILYLLIFILIHKNLFKNKIELFIIIFLLTFYSSGKITYILFSIPLFIYFLINNLNRYKYIFLYLFISILLIYFPLLFVKYNYFGNIFSPFFDQFLGNNREIYNAFVLSLKSSEGWLSNPSDISLYLKPFFSFDLSKLSSSLGLIFLLMIFDINLQKKLKYIPLTLIVLILLTGQILPRYYFEAFLLLAYFYKFKNRIIKLVVFSQLFFVIFFTSIFIFISYFELNVFRNKDEYLKRFSYSFYNSKQINNESLNGKVLDFSLDRDSVFIKENIYSIRYLDILNKFNNTKEKNLVDFINNNSIKYLIINEFNQIPKCIIYKQLGDTYRKKSVRNFLVKNTKIRYKIVEIKDNKCI